MNLGSAMRDRSRRSTMLWAAAFACWVAFVWGHSLVQGPASAEESGFVATVLEPLFRTLGVADFSLMDHIVRKSAHFLEYAVLGAIGSGLYGSLRAWRGTPAWAIALLVAAVPMLDELIQTTVPGRDGNPRDVLLDLAGAATGALVFRAVARLKKGANSV